MTTLREAALRALEVIDWYETHLREHHQCSHTDATLSGIPGWERKVYDELRAALEAQPQQEPTPAVLFDGYAVLQALSDNAKKRTSPDNVSDVLDAVVRLIRAQPTIPPECKTENEKRAFAFGWWKALEAKRGQEPPEPSTPPEGK